MCTTTSIVITCGLAVIVLVHTTASMCVAAHLVGVISTSREGFPTMIVFVVCIIAVAATCISVSTGATVLVFIALALVAMSGVPFFARRWTRAIITANFILGTAVIRLYIVAALLGRGTTLIAATLGIAALAVAAPLAGFAFAVVVVA